MLPDGKANETFKDKVMDTLQVLCVNTGATIGINPGTSLEEIATRIGIKLKHRVLGAKVNGRFVGLSYRVYRPKQIEFFDGCHPEGRRMLARTLVMMLGVAVDEVLEGVQVEVLHSVSKGIYCELIKDGQRVDPTTAEVVAILDRMRELQAAGLPIERKEMPTDEALSLLTTTPETGRLLRQHGELYTVVHSLDGHNAVMFGDLTQRTSDVEAFDLTEFFSGMLLRLPEDGNPGKLAEATLQNKMFATFIQFDKIKNLLRIRRLADLNDTIAAGLGRRVIQLSEALHEKQISDIADMIAERKDSVRVVLISGPSSSGKTTFSKRLSIQLALNGLLPVTLSIDNYFVDREKTPLDEDGKYDFEAVEAINVKLFNEQILALMRGEEVEIPKFDFVRGKSEFDGTKLRLAENSILVIEGTHGLTPALTPMIPDSNKFRIYVAPLAGINFGQLTRIHTTDNRLIRRIVRDYYNRGHDADSTIAMWPSVRRGEDKFIYTNQEEADVMFNSCTLYELAVLRAKAEPILLEVRPNSPQYGEAQRLLHFLSYFMPLGAETIPPTSLLREFVGGSSFEYD